MAFKYLPGFSNYGISDDGRVLNHTTGNWIGTTKKNVYVTLHLKSDDGNMWTIQRHRLVAMAYVDNSNPEEFDVVNHLDGVKGNDHPDNLEWTTHQKNHWHAGEMGITEKCKPVSTRNPTTGLVVHYPSATEAAVANGLLKDNVLWRIKRGEEKVWPEGLQYRLKDLEREWASPVNHTPGVSRAVLLKDTVKLEITRFETQRDLAASLGLSEACVSLRVKDPEQPLLKGRYLIKQDDDTPWREVTDAIGESRVNQAVVATEATTGKETLFMSAKECADKMGLKPSALNYRLNCDPNKIHNDGFMYRRYNA